MKSSRRTKGIFAVLLSAMLIVLAMGALAFAEDEYPLPDTLKYIDETGRFKEIKRGEGADEFKVMIIDWQITEPLTTGWYVAWGGGSITKRVEVQGDVKIIMMDHVELQFDGGLHVPEGSTLSIYGQSFDKEISGKLIAKGDNNTAGIGGNGSTEKDEQKTGTINMYSGNVESIGGFCGAGIGGGRGYIVESSKQSGGKEIGGDGGTFNMYGGWLTAQGGPAGAGIGGGYSGDSGTINIYGGTVTATGGTSDNSGGGGSGIGGGRGRHITYNGLTGGNANDIKIVGGKVKAYGAGGGAGIGAGAYANGSKVWYVNFIPHQNWVKIGGSADVYAKGSDGGAGIGGAMDDLNDWYEEGGGCFVEIYGNSKVEAIGGAHAAGIGAARSDYQGAGETIIKGNATVIAQGGDYAAGIGCADKIVTLSSYTKFRRLYDIKISGKANVTATGGKEAAGIGCGDEGRYGKSKSTWEAGNQGIVRITGEATVTAKGAKYGAGIGGGDQQVNGYVEIGGPVYRTAYSSNGRIDDIVEWEEENSNEHNPTVTATGGYGAAGIGCGDDTYDDAGCANIDIIGGTVNATGGDYGAGIGGADGSSFNGKITIRGGKITAKGVKQAAGIGGGNHWSSHGGGDAGPVEMDFEWNPYRGKVKMEESYVLAVSDADSAPIGHGDGGSSNGSLSITGKFSVKRSAEKKDYAGMDPETPVSGSEKNNACWNDSHKTVLIQYCNDTYKDALVYSKLYEEDGSLDGWIHKVECPYCSFNDTENHTPYAKCVPNHPEYCTKCGGEKYKITFKEGDPLVESTVIEVSPTPDGAEKPNVFEFPDPVKDRPDGKIFVGWSKGPNPSINKVRKPHETSEPNSDEEWIAMYGDAVKIIFDPNGGTGEMAPDEAAAGLKYELPRCTFTEPEGEAFAGWNTKKDGSGTTYQARKEYNVPGDGPNEITFYALWNHDHDFTNGHHERINPTCDTEGSIEYWQCSICKRVFKDEEGTSEVANKGDVIVPATGHLWGEPVYTWADDNSSVTAERICLNDSKHKETEEANEDNKKLSVKVTEVATCESEGEIVYTAVFENEAFEEQKETVIVPKEKHDWSDWETDPDDSTKEYRVCSKCNAREEREEGSHEHDSTTLEYVKEDPATCANGGKQGVKAHYKCKLEGCGKLFLDEEGNQEVTIGAIKIEPPKHKFGPEENKGGYVAPKCEVDGSYNTQRRCTVCETLEGVKSHSIPALGHDWDSGEVTEKATCTEDGVKEFTCLNDASHKKTQSISALGHSWDDPTYTWAADNSSVTAKHVCLRDDSHVEEEEVKTTEKVVKEATEKAEGEKVFTAEFKNEEFETQTKTVVIPKTTPTRGSDGTAVGPGASAAVAEKAILGMKNDNDPAGSKIAPLKLKSTKQTKKSVTVTWTKAKGAVEYIVYGNKCGKSNRMKKLATVKTNKKKFTKVAGKKVKKGTYYKFIIVALDKNNKVVSTSKVIHAATAGGKVGNHKGVTVKKTVVNKAKKLKKGKTLKLNAKAVAKSKKLKVKKHVAMRYESSNTKIATVNKKGVVKGVKKGSCYVYAYAQNGVSKKIKVTVK